GGRRGPPPPRRRTRATDARHAGGGTRTRATESWVNSIASVPWTTTNTARVTSGLRTANAGAALRSWNVIVNGDAVPRPGIHPQHVPNTATKATAVYAQTSTSRSPRP